MENRENASAMKKFTEGLKTRHRNTRLSFANCWLETCVFEIIVGAPAISVRFLFVKHAFPEPSSVFYKFNRCVTAETKAFIKIIYFP